MVKSYPNITIATCSKYAWIFNKHCALMILKSVRSFGIRDHILVTHSFQLIHLLINRIILRDIFKFLFFSLFDNYIFPIQHLYNICLALYDMNNYPKRYLLHYILDELTL